MTDIVIYKYLDEFTKQNASDMYLTVGYPPSIRKQGNEITALAEAPMQESDIEKFIDDFLDDSKKKEFANEMELNISLSRGDNQRFRFNFFRQQQHSGIVIRRIVTEIPSIKELHLPDIYANAIMKKSGLIILASPGGSGKSTSMAAMIRHRNMNSSGHIITIEDPIEFIHSHKGCVITQREVGSDTLSFHNALRNTLRQRADVIAIGEIRDRESMDHAIRFAEAGHLCVATLHSNNAAQAIDRMVNLFPDEIRSYILSTLSQTLISVFSQRLIDSIEEGKKLVAVDVLLNEGLIKELIVKDEMTEIKETQERLYNMGMRTFDQSLFDMFAQKSISLETAINEADNPSAIKLRINQSDLVPKKISITRDDDDYDGF